MNSKIRTRFLIISDTHGRDISAAEFTLQSADVAIHCGDLTDGSTMDEYRKVIALLKAVNAPLKLVIPGNHDFSMDEVALRAKIQEAGLEEEDSALIAQAYGPPEELFEHSKASGIVLLEEGSHTFDLQNGARLSLYASPYTPSLGAWGFQYHPDRGHEFLVESGTDVVVTHGPPKGILDLTYGRERAGCPHLFTAMAKERPKLHCFGHIHEGWGARLVRWKDTGTGHVPTHFTAIDNNHSISIQKLADLHASRYEDASEKAAREARVQQLARQRCAITSHCSGDELAIEPGKHTLFVNASFESAEGFPQRPWLVDLELSAIPSIS